MDKLLASIGASEYDGVVLFGHQDGLTGAPQLFGAGWAQGLGLLTVADILDDLLADGGSVYVFDCNGDEYAQLLSRLLMPSVGPAGFEYVPVFGATKPIYFEGGVYPFVYSGTSWNGYKNGQLFTPSTPVLAPRRLSK